MGLGRDACLQRQFHRAQHILFIVMQDQRQDIDHLTVTAGLTQHPRLQDAEGFGHLDEGSAVTQSPRLALNDGQIMAPIIDDTPWLAVGPLNDALMRADDMAFGHNHQALGVDVQADRAVGEAGGLAVAVTFETDQAGG